MKSSPKNQSDFIFETTYWEVYLNPDQYYLGRSVVVAKRVVKTLSELTDGEWTDFGTLVRKFETGLKASFNASMFNWTCLLNDAYKKDPPNPHVHWHVRPRYKSPVIFAGLEFLDSEFGHHYARGTDRVLPAEIITRIIAEIKKNL